MEEIKLTILGCGSALPTRNYFHASQLLEMRNKQFLIDCGEGTQVRMRQLNISPSRMNHIFISHLHADHCLGLVGLISSMGMLGRTADLYIHSHPDLEGLLQRQLEYFCNEMLYKVIFVPFNPKKHEVIYDDKSIKISTIPLKHRVPTCGFLFEEKPKARHIIREMINAYEIPIREINKIKEGADYVTPEGEVVPNRRLTTPPSPTKSYAYCSDTAFSEKIIPLIKGVDCLYHEATFAEDEINRAKQTRHSTARQAATIAAKAEVKQLVIGHYSARYKNSDPLLKEAKEVFDATIAGADGMEIMI